MSPDQRQLAELLPEFQWHTIRLTLAPTRNIGRNTPALVVLNALLKSVKTGQDADPERPAIKRAFRVPGQPAARLYLPSGKPFVLEVLFFGADDAGVAAWLNRFVQYLEERADAGFCMREPPVIKHSWGSELAVASPAPNDAELEVLSPLPFARPKGSSRTAVSLDQLLEQLRKRIKSLFGVSPALPDTSSICLQHNFWHYVQLTHASRSQPGHTQYYNGCVGSLYLSGPLAPVLPWLALGEAIHGGGSVALNPFGYFRLHAPGRPRLDRLLAMPEAWSGAFERTAAENDDWVEQIATRFGAPVEGEHVCRELIALISSDAWQPSPSMAFSVPKRGGMRRLEKLGAIERLVHAVAHELLSEPIDRVLEPAAFAYRRGQSAQMAIERVRDLLADGCRFVVESDIEDFFPSVDLENLYSVLSTVIPPPDRQFRSLMRKLLSASWIEGDRLHARHRGLAQGSPLSPLLANLYLDRFDEAIAERGGRMVRYADDFVILTKSREEAESLLDLARRELSSVGLSVGEQKTAILDVQDGFRFLGQPFGGLAADEAAARIVVPGRKTLYVTEPNAYLGHNGDALEIRIQGRPVETLPFRRISDIVVLDNASFSSGLVRKCAQHGVPLIFTLGSGYHVATLAPDSRRYHGIAERQALHYASLSATERLVLAKGFAAQKIANYKPLIESRYRRGDGGVLAELDQAIAGIEASADVGSVRGHEGRAARRVFKVLDEFLKVPEFRFSKRLRDKPDRMNCLFNFGYYLLFSRLNTMIRAAGINPYLGYLHDGADDYETLVCDVEELFRAPVDRMLVSLVNLKIISKDDFITSDKGHRLQPAAIKRFIQRFETLLHSDVGGMTMLRAMEAQVAALRDHVADGRALWFFRYKGHAGQHEMGGQCDGAAAEDRTDKAADTPPISFIDLPWSDPPDDELAWQEGGP